MMSRYSSEYKRFLVQKVLENPAGSVDEIAGEMKVSRASLFRWVKTYGATLAGFEKRAIRPSEWSTAQRIRALLESQHLNDHELGEYLRKNGLYYDDLKAWKSEILDEVTKNKKANEVPSTEAAYLRRIRQLEKELKMKEKALREATALINLKKKAEAFWGESEEEKSLDPNESTPKKLSGKRSKKGQD